MNEIVEQLAYRIGEGYQSSSISSTINNVNAFHRTVISHESSDISFINGLISTGLRGSALVDGDKIIGNYAQFLTASRQHLPLVVNTKARLVGKSEFSTVNNYDNINAIQQTGCFKLIASSKQEEVFFTLIAHRIAELALIPGVVIADFTESTEKVGLPADDLIINYLGNPDDQIDCPTAAQEIIFGKTRRRIPNWYSLDVPVMLGSKKDGEAISFEAAASQKYFYDHLPQLINQAYKEFNTVFGTNIQPVSSIGNSSEFAIITLGGQVNELLSQLSEESKKVGVITINQLNPFPSKAISELVKGKKAITILENAPGAGGSRSNLYFNVIDSLGSENIKLYSGKYSADLNADSLKEAIQHMVSGQSKMSYYLGLEFTKTKSSYPKHDILLQEIRKQYADIENDVINTDEKNKDASLKGVNEVPLAVRMYQDNGPNYSKLSRFYDNTAFFYENNEHHELVADPFAAIPVAPSASASFFNQATSRENIPVIDLKECSGDGQSFISCPHSALLPIVIGVEGLMKTGIELAVSKGITITKLTPMLKNLSKVAAKTISDSDIATVADFLPVAFDNLAAQMNLEGEKLEAAKGEFDAVVVEIGKLPIAVTDTFFNQPNTQEKGSGELFSLVINPSSCTGCGICAQVSNAITMAPQTTEILNDATEQFKFWEQLPDTSADTINRLFHDENYSSLAAMMLSRNYFMSMSGASSSENDNSFKTLLHIVTSTTESVVQPKIVNQIKSIDDLIESLSENIHNKLSQSLPKENLDQLSKSLKTAQGRKVSLQDLVSEISEGENNRLIDTSVLERKTDLVESLKNLKWVLSEGPSGVGRSRFGMLIAGENSMDWAKHYPANNFTSPSVIHWNGSAPEHTLGLFHGQLRYLLDNIKLMRRASLESKDKYDSSIHDLEIAELNWNDLTEDEKSLIPPVLLIAEKDDLNETGWSSLNRLLSKKYPLKVFLFDNVTSPNNSPTANLSQTTSGLFSTMALKSAYVFQGGMGNVTHLFDGLMMGLEKPYPAIFNLYATNFAKHGISNIDWSPYAALALNSRSFPSISFNPEEKSSFLDGAINIGGNNEITEDWITENISLSEEETLDYKITWADWAFTQVDWKSQFIKVSDDDNNVLVADFIQLDSKARKSKTPVIKRVGKEGVVNYRLSDEVVEMTEAVLINWNTLQELSGVTAKIPSKQKEILAKEISDKYEEEISALKKEYEKQLIEKEAAQTEKLKQQLKEKLVALSAMARN